VPPPSLVIQTTYAELLERCAAAAFSDAFPVKGAFTPKEIRGRRYWYFQSPTETGRTQKYVGPETSELLERISRHREARQDERERSALISTLLRLGMPRPNPQMGDVVAALANAGLFRLQSVLVGTIAYQIYSAIIGEKLPAQSVLTGDIDIAQFASVSKAIQDQTVPVFDILRQVNKTFAEVPKLAPKQKSTSYQTASRDIRVDFLTPNEGRPTDEPQLLPALQTYAQPPSFLDFLIHEPASAVMLHAAGIYVSVPAPERFAIHKLIVAQRRTGEAGKRDKDIQQAAALLSVLSKNRPTEIRHAWGEAEDRGKKWREALRQGLRELPQKARDLTLKTLERSRSIVPRLDLTFQNPAPRYVFDRDIIEFIGAAAGENVVCAISGEALEDHFGADNLKQDQRVEVFLGNRSAIEWIARRKFLDWPVDEPGLVLLKTLDVSTLIKTLPATLRERTRRKLRP
jgi:hypothetical protein